MGICSFREDSHYFSRKKNKVIKVESLKRPPISLRSISESTLLKKRSMNSSIFGDDDEDEERTTDEPGSKSATKEDRHIFSNSSLDSLNSSGKKIDRRKIIKEIQMALVIEETKKTEEHG